MRKLFIGLLLVIFSFSTFAGGYTVYAKPQTIEYVMGGILVKGDFGDVNSCGQDGYIFIKPTPDNPDKFKTMTSMIITALTAQLSVRFYTYECSTVSFHWGSREVVNVAHTHGFFLKPDY